MYLQKLEVNKKISRPLNRASKKYTNILQRVKNLPAGLGGLCGPSLLEIVCKDKDPNTIWTTAAIKAVAIQNHHSAVGEMLTRQQMVDVAGALGLTAVVHTFTDTATLEAALVATNQNPVIVGVQNVTLPGKVSLLAVNGTNTKLTNRNQEYLRAHWIMITSQPTNTSFKYKDNGSNSETTVTHQELITNQALLAGKTWKWSDYVAAFGLYPGATGADTTLDLSGYLIEFT